MKSLFIRLMLFSIFFLVIGMQDLLAEAKTQSQVLFQNVNVFDGETNKLHKNKHVLVSGNLISEISDEPLAVIQSTNMKVIDAEGLTLMPGLIESHVHLNFQHMVGGYETMEFRDWQEIGAMGGFVAHSLLMDGWTTARDPGASLTGIRTAIDRGDAIGPRLYMANATISQTSGHGDFRPKGYRSYDDRYKYKGGQLGMTHIVDGADAFLAASRQNLANGAAFLKIHMGGGIFSSKDPLHSVQSTDEEILAAVQAATAWDTYVTAHIYLPEHAQRAIRLGLKEILHIPYLDKETAQLMVKKGIFYNPQLSQSTPEVLEAIFGPKESVNKSKARVTQVAMKETVDVLRSVPELMETTTFGVDVVTNTPANALRTRDHEMWFWAENFGNFATLKAMTSNGGKLAALTGKWNPYPDGPLGVIKKGAYADILLVEGNPLEDMSVLGASEKMFDAPERKAGGVETIRLIMKDGKIYKNTL
ncbi:MAG: amidohydrolase family protein [bacterium]